MFNLESFESPQEAFAAWKEELKNVDMFEALSWFYPGMPITRCGSTKKIRCIAHADSNPSMLIDRKHLHCFSCGASFTPYSLCQKALGTKDGDVVRDFMAEKLGLPTSEEILNYFREKGKGHRPTGPRKKKLARCPLTAEDFDALRLISRYDRDGSPVDYNEVFVSTGISEFKPAEGEYRSELGPDGEWVYVKGKYIPVSVSRDLWNADENHELFNYVVFNRLKEETPKWIHMFYGEKPWLKKPFVAEHMTEKELAFQKKIYEDIHNRGLRLQKIWKLYGVSIKVDDPGAFEGMKPAQAAERKEA